MDAREPVHRRHFVDRATPAEIFAVEGSGTALDYRVALDVKAPLPGFVLRKVTDTLVSASIPKMFASIEREVRRRQARLT